MRKREFVLAGAAVMFCPLVGRTQVRAARIGVLTVIDRNRSSYFPAFVTALADVGYLEGKNLTIDYRSTSGAIDGLPALARELVASKPDLIIVHGPEHPARALLETRTSLPTVFIAVDYDPVNSGIVASYNQPGGNLTGVYVPQAQLAAKRFELTREILPKADRLLVLTDRFSKDQLSGITKAAAAASITLEIVEFTAPPYDFEAAFARGRKARAQALIGLSSPEFHTHRAKIVELGSKYRWPMIGFIGNYVEIGYLAGYGVRINEVGGRAASISSRILKGARPAELPVEQASHFEIGINLKTATALGITIPQSVLIRADRVIE